MRTDQIWIYDVASDSARKLVDKPLGKLPRFENATTATFATVKTDMPGTQDALWEIATSGGSPTKLFSAPKSIREYAWSPGRSAVAFIGSADYNDFSLFVWRRGGGVSKVRDFGSYLGRGGGDRDEIAVRWSPDGERVLVVLTPLDTANRKLMYVIRHGADVVPARDGTQAFWTADGKAVVYSRWDRPNDWRRLDVASGSETAVGMKTNATRPAPAPGTQTIAYDMAVDDLTIHLYDMTTGSDSTVARDAVAPVWLGPGMLAVTDVRRCNGDCEGNWRPKGTTSRVGVGGARTTLALGTTVGVDVWYV